MTTRNDYFRSFCDVSLAFSRTEDRKVLLDLIVENVIRTMKGKAACLFLADETKEFFIPAAQKGLSKDYLHAGPERATQAVKEVLKGGYLAIKDATADPRLENHEAKKAEGIASLLVVPVRIHNRVMGVLSLYTGTPRDFSRDEIDFLMALAEQGGMAIEHARLVEQLRKNTRLFHDLATGMNSTLDLKSIMDILSAGIARALEVKAVSVRLLDEDKRTLRLVASVGLSENYLNKGRVSAEKSIAEALRGKPVVIKDSAKDSGVQYRKEKEEEGIVSILCVPIKAQEEVIGVLRLYSAVSREFSEDEIMLVTALAHQGGLAIRNASLVLMLQDDMKNLKEDIWSHRSWF
jgi:GAF domain-containing protein